MSNRAQLIDDPDTTPDGRAFLTIRALARLTGIRDETLYRLAHKGRIPGARKLGGRVLIARSVFERFFDEPTPRSGKRSS